MSITSSKPWSTSWVMATAPSSRADVPGGHDANRRQLCLQRGGTLHRRHGKFTVGGGKFTVKGTIPPNDTAHSTFTITGTLTSTRVICRTLSEFPA